MKKNLDHPMAWKRVSISVDGAISPESWAKPVDGAAHKCVIATVPDGQVIVVMMPSTMTNIVTHDLADDERMYFRSVEEAKKYLRAEYGL